MIKRLPKMIIVLFLLAGFCILFYPTFSNWYNEKFHEAEINGYTESISYLDTNAITEQLDLAEKYNNALTGKDLEDPFVENSGKVLSDNYNDILNIREDGMMGYIEIPKIDVKLSIYHGVSSQVLEKGVGHMEMTAFPTGGEGNHSVLTGHTGLTSARLFTDLDQLEIGDEFYITILYEVRAYEVDQIKVIEPNDTSDLLPVEGEDYITLVTCTPYGINSHRLLVRGTRTEYIPEEEGTQEADTFTESIMNYSVIIAITLLIIVVGFTIIHARKRRKKLKK